LFQPVAFVMPQILVAGEHFANSQACTLLAANLAKRCITDTDHRRQEQIILQLVGTYLFHADSQCGLPNSRVATEQAGSQ
jgi:hypothetical protein